MGNLLCLAIARLQFALHIPAGPILGRYRNLVALHSCALRTLACPGRVRGIAASLLRQPLPEPHPCSPLADVARTRSDAVNRRVGPLLSFLLVCAGV